VTTSRRNSGAHFRHPATRIGHTALMTKAAFTKKSRPAGLVITPGASADRDHAMLLAIEHGIPELPVLRLTLATTSVPNAVKKIIEAGLNFADEIGVNPNKLAYGGRSFGGRACSVAVAEGLAAAALVLLSYPLHPPGKLDKLRVGHFPAIGVPTLLVSGEKDPFGKPDEFAAHLSAIAGQTTMAWVPGNHSPKGNDEIVEIVRSYLKY
jgi:predicted alpha/beta-hydrolase family hydrolase